MSFLEMIISFDKSLFILINSSHTPFFDFFFQGITWFGSGWIITPLLIGIILKMTPKRNWRQMIICGATCISISGLINSQLKHLVQRDRPPTHFSKMSISEVSGNPVQTQSYSVRVLGPKLYKQSFPSGHTNTAFAAATFLVLMYGGFFWSGYLIACLVAYSRIYMGVHFFVDTAGGALLGVITVWLIWNLFLKMSKIQPWSAK